MPTTTSTHQSHFLSLPGEIRNRIYHLALTTSAPVTDALFPNNTVSFPKSAHHSIPPLGAGLLRTCRHIHDECPVHILYQNNVFRFTSAQHCHAFLTSLPPFLRAAVRTLELDIRDWPSYCAYPAGTAWAKTMGCLAEDAPALNTVVLNFEAWPRVRVTRRHLWDILRRLLCNIERLDRVVLTGSYASGTAMERRKPWDAVFYTGTDDVPTDDIVDRMWGMVAGYETHREGPLGEGKLIRWERDQQEGKIALEVVALRHLANQGQVESALKLTPSDTWPASGACTFEDYLQRKEMPSTP
ncbi:hypothetical protein IWX90DRAFT_391574 [Phyllosticta citrichinensis]|uniref:DUF7730 domain-containing protein n=1 Tax=Phyllosticta citrichinensis TaxID=1130410 RepID=A0ABR1XID1_9PEZI